MTKALEAMLASPQFLFRVEESQPALAELGAAGSGSRLGDYELASRLSFFLWGTGPDAELLKLAGQGRLALPGALAKQARRMLIAPRADALATRFAAQWLRLQDLERVMPDPILYPVRGSDAVARAAARRPSCSSTAWSARTAACSIC